MKDQRHYAILISPKGEEWYVGYLGPTQDRSKACKYKDAGIATGGANRSIGNAGDAFWDSEIDAAAFSRKKYRDWTFRVEPTNGWELTTPDIHLMTDQPPQCPKCQTRVDIVQGIETDRQVAKCPACKFTYRLEADTEDET